MMFSVLSRVIWPILLHNEGIYIPYFIEKMAILLRNLSLNNKVVLFSFLEWLEQSAPEDFLKLYISSFVDDIYAIAQKFREDRDTKSFYELMRWFVVSGCLRVDSYDIDRSLYEYLFFVQISLFLPKDLLHQLYDLLFIEKSADKSLFEDGLFFNSLSHMLFPSESFLCFLDSYKIPFPHADRAYVAIRMLGFLNKKKLADQEFVGLISSCFRNVFLNNPMGMAHFYVLCWCESHKPWFAATQESVDRIRGLKRSLLQMLLPLANKNVPVFIYDLLLSHSHFPDNPLHFDSSSLYGVYHHSLSLDARIARVTITKFEQWPIVIRQLCTQLKLRKNSDSFLVFALNYLFLYACTRYSDYWECGSVFEEYEKYM